jgi:hypothetical protein
MATTTEPQLTRSIDEPEAVTYSLSERVMRALLVPVRLAGALILPDRTMPRVVARERGTAALLTVMLFAGIAAFVVGSRLDPTAAVLAQETQMMQMQGKDAEPRSDRDIAETIDKQRTMGQVMLGLSAGFFTPFLAGLLAMGVFAAGRFVGGKPSMPKSFAAASHAMLPMAVKSAAIAVTAWSAQTLSPMEIEKLGKLGVVGPLGPLAGVDLFVVWSVVLLWFGLAAAASITRRRALVTTLVAFAIFMLVFGDFAAAGGPGPHGPHGPMPPRGAQ